MRISFLLLFQDAFARMFFVRALLFCLTHATLQRLKYFFLKQFEISKSFWVERFSQCALWSRGMEESFLWEFPVLRENGGIVCLSKSFFRIWWNLEDLIKSWRSLSSSEFQVLTVSLTPNKNENLNGIFELPTKTLLGWSSYT